MIDGGRLNSEVHENETPHPPPRYRWGAICVVSAPLIILNTIWIANSEMRMQVTQLTASSLFLGIAFMLAVLVAVNRLARKIFGPARAFNQPEMMALYSILSMSSVVAGVGNIGYLIPMLATPFAGSFSLNLYRAFWFELPPYMYPRGRLILQEYANGHSTFFQSDVIKAWLPPLMTWGVFFLLLLWLNFCTATILRKRWVEEEHLPFPIVALPLEMTKEDTTLFRNKLFWLGFAIPAILHTLNTIAGIVPGMPKWPINTVTDITTGLVFPWTGLAPIQTAVHPAGIGFGYLVNTDVLFSMWFFFLFRKVLNLLGVVLGWRDPFINVFVGGDGSNQFPYTAYQSYGAWLFFALLLLYQNRIYLRGYVTRALTGRDRDLDQSEPMSARACLFGIVGCFIALCAFIWTLHGSWWLPPAILGIYLLFMITLARLQAETAVLSSDLNWVSPMGLVVSDVGTLSMQAIDRVHMGIMGMFNLDYRAAPMPHQFQAMVGQQRAGGSMKPLPIILMAAAALALVCAMLSDLQLYYVQGADTSNINDTQTFMAFLNWADVWVWTQHPAGADPHCLHWMGVGAAVTLLISLLRTRFVGFPFSPAGFVLSTTSANDIFWLDIFLAWVAKVALLRYGGIRAYRTALPLFFGLILGDFFTGAFWSIVAAITHVSLFQTFPR